MIEILLLVMIAIVALVVILQIVTLKRSTKSGDPVQMARLELLERAHVRIEQAVKDEIAKNREETGIQGKSLRQELAEAVKGSGDTVVRTLGEFRQAQQNQLETFSRQLTSLIDANQVAAQRLREEVGAGAKNLNDSILKQMAEISTLQKSQLEGFSGNLVSTAQATEKKLEGMRETVEARLTLLQQDSGTRLEQMRKDAQDTTKQTREESAVSLRAFGDSMVKSMTDVAGVLRGQLESFSAQLVLLIESNNTKHEALRAAVDAKLTQIQEDNGKRLEEMRKTVDEKLQGTLEKRLGESFKLVSERLEQVHKGLGEMQTLATGVGDLKKVLTNVKARGTWGEIQLGNLLEQVLSPEQYGKNIVTREGTSEAVEFAIKLPGGSEQDGGVVWLPIDAKFPMEDYRRLVEASERADADALETAGKQLELRIRSSAKEIRDKYLNPPTTTDFGIMFLASEGLYAEALRRPGLVEALQRECRVNVAGPTTLAALLNSLQMGFRTLAIQKRSSEVWSVLGAIKTEFGKFGAVIERVQRKLQEASNAIDPAARRIRAIDRKLRTVEELPAADAQKLLASEGPEADEALVEPDEQSTVEDPLA